MIPNFSQSTVSVPGQILILNKVYGSAKTLPGGHPQIRTTLQHLPNSGRLYHLVLILLAVNRTMCLKDGHYQIRSPLTSKNTRTGNTMQVTNTDVIYTSRWKTWRQSKCFFILNCHSSYVIIIYFQKWSRR